jgi:acyl-CoA reductase-like NAD-dependent aldehyde dehydrogenase
MRLTDYAGQQATQQCPGAACGGSHSVTTVRRKFVSRYTVTIDGQPVSSEGTLKVVNPATGAVFAEVPDCTREQQRAAEVAEKLEAGTVWVNTPFTGMKWSGLGSEMGLWSIYAYTDPRTVFRTRSQVVKKGADEAPDAW